MPASCTVSFVGTVALYLRTGITVGHRSPSLREFTETLSRLALSQREIADIAGVSQQAVSAWSRGQQPRYASVRRLDAALELNGRLVAAWERDVEGEDRERPERRPTTATQEGGGGESRGSTSGNAAFTAQCELLLRGAGFGSVDAAQVAGLVDGVHLRARPPGGSDVLVECRVSVGTEAFSAAVGRAVLLPAVADRYYLLLLARRPRFETGDDPLPPPLRDLLNFSVVALDDARAAEQLRALARRQGPTG